MSYLKCFLPMFVWILTMPFILMGSLFVLYSGQSSVAIGIFTLAGGALTAFTSAITALNLYDKMK